MHIRVAFAVVALAVTALFVLMISDTLIFTDNNGFNVNDAFLNVSSCFCITAFACNWFGHWDGPEQMRRTMAVIVMI